MAAVNPRGTLEERAKLAGPVFANKPRGLGASNRLEWIHRLSEFLAWVALGLGYASALFIVADIVVLGNWQHMAIMNLAVLLTAL